MLVFLYVFVFLKLLKGVVAEAPHKGVDDAEFVLRDWLVAVVVVLVPCDLQQAVPKLKVVLGQPAYITSDHTANVAVPPCL